MDERKGKNSIKEGHVAIAFENKGLNGNTKIKFSKMPSITEQYQRKLSGEELIYCDELMSAISKNDVEICKKLLEDVQNIYNMNQKYFFHPLLLAAKKGRFEILKLLLGRGADVNIQDKKNFTALHYALQQRNIVCCNLLLDHNININCEDKFGNIPLHVAASEGIVEIVKVLLEKTIDVNVRNKKDQTPLHFAAIKGNDEILNLLLEKGARWDFKDINFWLPIHCAAFNGQYGCCSILVDASGEKLKEQINSRNKEQATPLILAAKKGHSRCCQNLSQSDINAYDNKGNTALHLAASIGFISTVEVLLQMNPDVTILNKSGNTPVHKAALQKDLNCLKMLIEYPGFIPGTNSSKETLIHLAAVINSADSLKYLLENELLTNLINAKDIHGKSALHVTLNQGHSECAETLISAQIDCSLIDDNGNLPLHVAAGSGLHNICKLLLSGKRIQTISERNFHGTTPLHFAAMNGSVDCCKLLLHKGADLNALDSSGFSPFHVASYEGNLEIVKIFTRKGGGFINQIVEISGDTTLHLAARKGSFSCCNFILRNIKRDYIFKLNNNENSVLDDAYNSEHDEIFGLVLSKIPIPKPEEKYKLDQYNAFQLSLHEYMHSALEGKRKVIIKSILDSCWWYAGFSSSLCSDGKCQNLVKLTKQNPVLIQLAYDKCIKTENGLITYNFRLFEDSYYVPLDASTTTCLRRHSPFDDKTGKLMDQAVLHRNQGSHPLYVTADSGSLSLMKHPIVEALLRYKWDTYMWMILLSTILSESTLVVLLGVYLSCVMNYDSLKLLNVTKNVTCYDETELPEVAMELIEKKWVVSLVFYCILVFTCGSLFITEININLKIKQWIWDLLQAARLYRLVGICILVFPVNFCIYDIVVKETWQWQIGILTLLLSWMHMIHEINLVPSLSISMPLTTRFVRSFIKAIFYIILFILIFAFIFHLLLQDQRAFVTLPYSFIKTTVWVLGDLNYDAMFIEKVIMYPKMTIVMFLLLVTSITGFIANLVIAQPANHLSSFREKAFYFEAASRIKLFLKLDSIFDVVKKRYLVGFHEVEMNANTEEFTYKTSPVAQTHIYEQNGGDKTPDQMHQVLLQKLEKIEAQLAELNK